MSTHIGLKKIVASILVLILLWSDFFHLGKAFVSWGEEKNDEKPKVQLLQEVSKYVPYVYENGEKGIILQIKIKMNIAYPDGIEKMPVQQTKITNVAPAYHGIKPEKAEVTTIETMATNGKGEKDVEFTEANYNYDEQKGITTIQVNNDELSIGNGEDEYYITYFYGEEAYDKYLDTTHVKEYSAQGGEIAYIKRDEQSGKAKVYITVRSGGSGIGNGFNPGEGTEPPEFEGIIVDLEETQIKLETQFMVTFKKDESSVQKDERTEENLNLDLQILETNGYEVKSNVTEMLKSKIKASQETGAIPYQLDERINISAYEQVGVFESCSLDLKDNDEVYIEEDGTEVGLEGASYYKQTRISKKSFENIFGQEGTIEILDNSGQQLASIDKNTLADENGNYVVNYAEKISKIEIKISQPINNGILSIKHDKTIKTDLEIEKADKILRNNSRMRVYGENGTLQFNYFDIQLKDTQTKATLELKSPDLSTDNINQNVSLEIALNNSNLSSDLWGNSRIIVEMPEEVTNLEVTGKDILYQDELSLGKVSIINFNGHKAIDIVLVGIQKQYIASSIIQGTTILLKTNIEIDALTPASKNHKVNLYYYNNMVTEYDNPTIVNLDNQQMQVGQSTATVNYSSVIGMKSVQQISEFDENGTIISSLESGKKLGKINILDKSKTAKINLMIINNTGNKCTDIRAIGRIPYANNKQFETGEDLGTTITTQLEETIGVLKQTNKIINIYYSENGEANTDLQNVENGWQTQIEDKSKIKSYMITMDELDVAEKIEFSYTVRIPEKLEHGEYLYSAFATYYTNNSQEGLIEGKKVVDKVGLTTGIGAKMNAEMEVSVGNGITVNEDERIKYKITVKNTGTLIAKNVIVKNVIPEGATFIQEEQNTNAINTRIEYKYYANTNSLEWQLGDIEVGEKIVLEFEVEINKIPTILEYYGNKKGFSTENGKYYLTVINEETGEEEKQEITEEPKIVVKNMAKLTCENIEKEIDTNIVENPVAKIRASIKEEASINKSMYIQENQEFIYKIMIESQTETAINNVLLNKTLPKGVKYEKTEINGQEVSANYNEDNRKLSFNINGIEANGMVLVQVYVKAEPLEEEIYEKQITTNTQITINNGQTISSNSVTNFIGKPKITAETKCDINERYVYEGDFINYTIKAKNESNVMGINIELTDYLPENISFVIGNYTKNGIESSIVETGSDKISVKTNLKKDEEIVIYLKLQVNNLADDIEEKDVINKIEIKGDNIETKQIGLSKFTIINQKNEDNPNNKPNVDIDADGNISYRITGSAWFDENKDGERADSEAFLSGITVYLLNEDGSIVKDKKTGQEKVAITDVNGDYQFKGVDKGAYLVVFIYDSEQYELTEYRKMGVTGDRNSDTLLTNINFNGKQIEGAVTDIVQISNRNIYAIDIGLKLKPVFDLKIEKQIAKVTVKNKKGDKINNYENKSFVKEEIKARQLSNTTLVIEYKIKVTNVGDIEGTASKIKDIKPESMQFNLDLNKDWYEGSDGNLYTAALAETMIQPGETKELTLVGIKNMEETNTGMIENNVQIEQTYNTRQFEDKDNSNNKATANCLVSIATGKIVIYTTIIMISLILICTILVYLKRKNDKKIRKRKVVIK